MVVRKAGKPRLASVFQRALLDDLMGEVADSAADCFIAFLRDQPPTMSDENTDHVLDKHIMGEVVMSESTFPAAPLVRPPMMVPNLMASSHLGAASAAVAPGAPDGAAAAACQGSLAGFAEPGTTSCSSVVWRQLSLEAGSARSA